MITDSEKKALQLAKKVFEHFTHDSLPFAREILAMELKLGESHVNEKSMVGVTISDVPDSPVSDISIFGLDDPAQPVKKLNDELVYQSNDDFPF